MGTFQKARLAMITWANVEVVVVAGCVQRLRQREQPSSPGDASRVEIQRLAYRMGHDSQQDPESLLPRTGVRSDLTTRSHLHVVFCFHSTADPVKGVRCTRSEAAYWVFRELDGSYYIRNQGLPSNCAEEIVECTYCHGPMLELRRR